MRKTMKKDRHIIYTNKPGWITDEELRESIIENESLSKDIEAEEITQDDIYKEQATLEEIYFDDEMVNMDRLLDGEILVIASLGLWNGRRQGYKILRNQNLNNILTCAGGYDYFEVYADEKNILAECIHHDGRNYLQFREIRPERKDTRAYQKLISDLYYGRDISQQQLNYVTRSVRPYAAEIYGW